ncbi:biotin--[acetyl-CoA-carboxylase] ligase [Flavobacterium sp.]|uniref:biotin--[acetyl-CoA-carboxylase] ligase n=1 Tax=Flavobacterium sp. TaxID=239 RepID=UPI002626940E|nr:biotin--[acetyl-CoA-carboxylase] ligase [Flavobacterium sp.]
MHIIKLSAIDSTNDYLKDLCAGSNPENFTVVSAETQTKGRGQMGTTWLTEPGKNLIMSLLIKEVLSEINQIFLLNAVVATAITQALKTYDIPELSIKWPNDILSANKKIGGILIENSIRNDGKIVSIVGIGLNVNQTEFQNLPKASSLFLATGKILDKNEILEAIVNAIMDKVSILQFHPESIWEDYNSQLFRKNTPSAFEDADGNRFMGMVHGVTADGRLQLLLEDDSEKHFGIKEISMLY